MTEQIDFSEIDVDLNEDEEDTRFNYRDGGETARVWNPDRSGEWIESDLTGEDILYERGQYD